MMYFTESEIYIVYSAPMTLLLYDKFSNKLAREKHYDNEQIDTRINVKQYFWKKYKIKENRDTLKKEEQVSQYRNSLA